MLVDMGAIPRSELLEQQRAKGFGNYLTVDLVGEIEVSTDVVFRVKRGARVEQRYSTKLENKGGNPANNNGNQGSSGSTNTRSPLPRMNSDRQGGSHRYPYRGSNLFRDSPAERVV